MTTNKPEVVAYRHINKESPGHRGVSLHHDASCTSTLINTEPLIRLSDYERLQADHERLQAECERLRNDAEATRKSVKLLNYLFARNIIAMQSAVIEWEKGKGAAAGMQWIWNTLFGPGQIPDEGETDAQAYFDREIEPLDAAMQDTSHE